MAGYRTKLIIFIALAVCFLTYSYVLYTSDVREAVPASAAAQKGKLIWQQKNCQACHQIYGLGGHLGPDLTNVYSNRTEAYIRAFLKVGTPVMPDFQLSKNEMDDLVEFFKYINLTGISDPKSFKKHPDGTISQ